MKVIFLDIDGVLNNVDLLQHQGWDAIGEELVDKLRLIVLATGAKIVLSSTWRLTERNRNLVRAALAARNMEFIDVTIDLWNKPRGMEILEWLSRHPHVKEIAVLDDMEDAGIGVGEGNFFQTDLDFGLTDEITRKVIEHLGCAHVECTQDEMVAS